MPSNAELLAELATKGYAHVVGPLSADQFAEVCEGVGTIGQRGPVRPNPPGEHFHTDNPETAVSALYCFAQDPLDGTTEFLDMAGLESALTPEELAALATLEVEFTMKNFPGGDATMRVVPMLRKDAVGWGIHWNERNLLFGGHPRNAPGSDTPEQAAALGKFAAFVAGLAPIRIRLAPGEGLLWDDRRFLHGRGPIAEDSPRRLERILLFNDDLRGPAEPPR